MTTYDLNGHLETIQPLATCSADLMDREGKGKTASGGNQPTPVPHMTTAKGDVLYFPGTGIRGKVRRCARDVLREAMMTTADGASDTSLFSLAQHYFLSVGGVKGKEELNPATVKLEAQWRVANPLLSLFGAGAAGVLGFVTGHLSVGNAVCDAPVAPVIFSGARSDDLYRDKEQVRYLSDADLDNLVEQASGAKSSAKLRTERKKQETALKKTTDAAKKAEAQARIEAIDAEIAQIKEDSGAADVAIGMPLAGWKAIPEGQTLRQRMLLTRSNAIELGLLLAALERFAMLPVLGAKYACGCGLVRGHWEVFEVTPAGRVSLGTVTMNEFEPLQLDGEELVAARAAFQFWLTSGQGDFSIPHINLAAAGKDANPAEATHG